MITTTNETHKIELNDNARVVELLQQALANNNFHSFNMYIQKDFPLGQKGPVRSYHVDVEMRYDNTQKPG